MQLANRLQFNNPRGDLFDGLTAAIVALPFALAFSVASGAEAIASGLNILVLKVFDCKRKLAEIKRDRQFNVAIP